MSHLMLSLGYGGPRGPEIDTSFPDDPTTGDEGKGPTGPVFNGQSLQDLTPEEDEDDLPKTNPTTSVDEKYGQKDKFLDGVSLAALGATDVRGPLEGNLAVLCALQLTPDMLSSEDRQQQATHSEVQTFLTPRKSKAVVLGCGAGGALLALEGLLDVVIAIDPD